MLRAKDLAYIAIFVAIMAVCSWISIPLPLIVFTMQTFAVSFAAFFLGFRRSLLAIIAYLILGACGVPVFNSFTAGVSSIVGVTGGFLVGFIPMVMVISIIFEATKKSFWGGIVAGAVGLIVLYIVGLPWMTAIGGGVDQTFGTRLWANLVGMLLFLLFDFIKMILALTLTKVVGKHVHLD